MAWLQHFFLSLGFFTRLPVPARRDVVLAQAAWSFPLAGALIGALTGFVFTAALAFGLAAAPAGWLALGFQILLTGGLHEDGLADTADGLAGGRERTQRLAILRDSRIGSYGALALVVVLALRAGAMATFSFSAHTLLSFAAAGAASRALLALCMHLLPPARIDGLAASAGKPSLAQALVSCGLGAAFLLAALPPGQAFACMGMLCFIAAFVRCKTLSAFGGITGDVLGALQQIGETALLLAFSMLVPK